LLGYSVLEGVGSDITTLPDFVRAKFCHEIDMRRLIAGSHRKGEQVTTYTIEDASFVVSEMNFAQTILLHVGINNLKSQPAEGYSVLEGVGSDITTLPDFVRAKFTRFENWESTSSAGWE
jgi:hypothetical protein